MNFVFKLSISLMILFLLSCKSENRSQISTNKCNTVPWNQWKSEEEQIFSGFMDAIFRNDYSYVEKCILNGLSCDFTTETGLSPIELAALAGHDKIVALLIKNGARIVPSELAKLGVIHQSITILEQSGFKQGITSNPLAYALKRGVSDDIINYLLDDYLKKEHNMQHNVECYNSLLNYGEDQFYPDISRKVTLVKKLLHSGVAACSSNYSCNFEYIVRFSALTKDTSLLKSLYYDFNKLMKRRQNYLNTRLIEPITLKTFDSLLQKGANPFEIYYRYGEYDRESPIGSAFEILKDYGYSALNFLKLKSCIRLNPDLAREKMDQKDSLFIAAVSNDMEYVIQLASTEKGLTFLTTAKSGKGLDALAPAASTGDTTMSDFFLNLPFGEKERETALFHAVISRNLNGVKILIKHGVNPNLPHLFNKNGLVTLLLRMFEDRYLTIDSTPGIDIKIAEILLTEASYYNSSSSVAKDSKSALPVKSFLMKSSDYPELFRFLWTQQIWPVDKEGVFSIPGYINKDLFYDKTIMKSLNYQGNEDTVIKIIISKYGGYDYDKRHITENLIHVIDDLNKLIVNGVALDKNLDKNWTVCLDESEGKYQIGFDFNKRRFIPVWNIPSLFSSRAAFIYWDD